MLGENPNEEVSPEEHRFNREALTRLSLNEVLRKTLRLSMKAAVINALNLLSKREFEQAYAALQSFDAIEEIDTILEDAKEGALKQEDEGRVTNNEKIKY